MKFTPGSVNQVHKNIPLSTLTADSGRLDLKFIQGLFFCRRTINHTLHGSIMDCYTTLRPRMISSRMEITAITRSMWIIPPREYPTTPIIHPIIISTAIKYSSDLIFLSLSYFLSIDVETIDGMCSGVSINCI